VIVIGSGPAGVAAARALAERGHEVTILDAGRTAAERLTRKYAPLTQSPPAEWDPELVEELRQEFQVSRDELPPKPVLGSLHPYAADDPSAPERGSGVGLTPSLGRGGLSAVWGASVLPYRESDLVGWPIGLADLAPYYASVLRFLPLASRHDRLEPEFPLYSEEPRDLLPTRQIDSLLADLEKGAAGLEARGIVAGRARVAVRTTDGAGGRACRYTGLCLHGCPVGSIWSGEQALDELRSRWGVRYLPGSYVERLTEGSAGVEVRFQTGDRHESLQTERVFVAAGVLPTTRLMLHSLDAAGQAVELCDSQYYTFPLLRLKGTRVSVQDQGNTLAQAFVELNDEDPRGSAHIQVYGYSDLMLREVGATLRLPPRLAEKLAQPLLSRLLFCQGYLHSERSRRIRAELQEGGSGASLDLSPEGSAESVERRVQAVLGRLRGAARQLQAVPLRPLLQVWEPGRGVHVGGSFPMSSNPVGLQSDLLGRPAGLRRIHLVDSSVFPSVPPTTITYTVMANAQRIAAEFGQG
jgi:choline dehydrogenase-like flavoprotein